MVHATLVARRLAGEWRGALLRGPSGAGKSDLALRSRACGFRLVADDRVVVWRSGERAFGRAPAPLRELEEVRGLGVAPAPALAFAPVCLVVDLQPEAERVPEADRTELGGLPMPRIALSPFGRSAPDRLLRGLELFGLA